MYFNGVILNANNYSALFSSGNSTNTLSVPVNPNAVIYSQFEHIHGIAATSNQEGISVSRISILNTLISQLQKMHKTVETDGPITKMTQEQQDNLIKQYQENVRNAIKTALEQQSYGYAGLLPETGAVFSIQA